MTESNAFYRERLDRRIPWGTSTCAKRATLTPDEPSVVVSGKGCRVRDADGREFIDFRCALGPITLGYAHPEVDAAIRLQLDSGMVFGYPHPLEAEVAELLCEVVPCAEKARFLKTGGEAVAACVKIARAATGRDHVIQIGYNGWLNSLAAGGMALPGRAAAATPPGVPAALAALHHVCRWNDPEQLEALGREMEGRLAAVVVAADYETMEAGQTFYPLLRSFADRHGAALVFDEIVTGFRIALAGAQEYFQVAPDMAVFAKGVANGMPLAVYCGRAAWMDALDKAIVSSTYGGEALSLAAAKTVVGIYRREPVIDRLWKAGKTMWEGMDGLFRRYGVPARMDAPRPVSFCRFRPEAGPDLPGRVARAMCRAGLLFYGGGGYVNYAHGDADLAEALERAETGLKGL